MPACDASRAARARSRSSPPLQEVPARESAHPAIAPLAAALISFLLAPALRAQPDDTPVPTSLLFLDAGPRYLAISPDGEWIGYVERSHAGDALQAIAVGTYTSTHLALLPRGDLLEWRWAENGDQVILTLDDGEGRRQLFALNLNQEPDLDPAGRITIRLAPGEMIALTPGPSIDAELLATDPWNPDEILVSVRADQPLASGIRRVNTRTGASRLIQETNRDQSSASESTYFAGGGLELRAASRPTASGGLNAAFRDSVRETWLELGRWEWLDALASHPLRVSGDGRAFYVADSRDRDTAALLALRVDDVGQMTYDVLAEHARADLSEVVYHPRSGHLQAAAFDFLRREWIVLDPAVRDDWAILSDLAPEGDFSILSRDRSNRHWIVEIRHPNRPSTYVLYDHRQRSATPLLDEVDPPSAPAMELETTAFSITARDGLKLPSYLTLPRSFAGAPIPVVLIVHDGPWSRVGPGFDPLHIWLASRGVGALSVNFRGSSGFGKQFAEAGHREWSGAIQDDLIDASLWLIEEGIADPDRLVILGEGFGGYSVLAALAATPEFFAAGIAIDPIVDLTAMADGLAGERERALFSAMVAPLDDAAQLALLSPINHIDSIVQPLLIARTHEKSTLSPEDLGAIKISLGARDIRLRTIDVAAASLPSRNARWIAVLDEVERFLQTHIGGSTDGDDAIGSAIDEVLDRRKR